MGDSSSLGMTAGNARGSGGECDKRFLGDVSLASAQ